MTNPGEVNGLLGLIDDPDEDIFAAVSERIIDLGKEIIPRLEHIWEHTGDTDIQQRIESLIHRVYFRDLEQDFVAWNAEDQPDLLRGAMLVARYQYPGLNETDVEKRYDQCRKSVWLELNNLMTPLEQVNVLNSVLYKHFQFVGHNLNERNPNNFFINHLLESRHGNAYSIGIIYLNLCEALDIPVFAVDVARQFVFAYIDTYHNYIFPDREGIPQIHFYIDPINGNLFNHADVIAYLDKINVTDRKACVTTQSNRQVVRKLLEELMLCYRHKKEAQKAADIQSLIELIDA
jgi:regulator of sirC expression with transglutaminase-like and TPR domain